MTTTSRAPAVPSTSCTITSVPESAPFTGAVRDALIAAGIRPRTRMRSGFSLRTLNAVAPVRVIVTWHSASLAPRRADCQQAGLRQCQTAVSAAQFSVYSLSDADGPHLAVWPKAGAAPGSVRA